MSDKIALTDVAQTLKTHKLEPSVVREILEELSQLASDAEADKAEPAPRTKQQFVVVVADKERKLRAEALTGWVVQIPEEAAPPSVIDRINEAAHAFNASKKGRLLPVKSIGEAFESVKRRFLKEAGITVKTKTPIYLIPTDNVLTEPPTA